MPQKLLAVSSPTGGISSQPVHLQYPTQFRRGRNVHCLAGIGCARRAGTNYIAKLTSGTDPSAGSDLRLHSILRDLGEQYIVAYGWKGGNFQLRVFTRTGVEATVTVDTGVSDYIRGYQALDATAVDYDHSDRLLTFTSAHGITDFDNRMIFVETGDGTNLPAGYYPIEDVPATTTVKISATGVNASGTTVFATADTSNTLVVNGTWSATTDEVGLLSIADTTLVWNKQVKPQAGTEPLVYTVQSPTYKDYGVMTSILGSPDLYYRAENDDGSGNVGFFQYKLATADNGWANWVGPNATSGWKGPGGNYDELQFIGFRIRFQYQTLANTTNVSFDGTNLLTFTSGAHGFTYAAGYYVYVSVGDATNLPAGYYPVTAVGAVDTLTINPAAGIDATGAALSFTPGADTGLTCDSIHTGLVEVNADVSPRVADMFEVAEALEASLQSGTNCTNALINWTSTGTTRGNFQVIAPFRGTGTAVTQILAPTAGNTTNLTSPSAPFRFADGTANAGMGTPTSVTATVASRWEEVPASGDVGSEINQFSMPMKLTRTSLSPLAFQASVINWDKRTSGDSETNEGPNFVKDGTPIADMALFANRLWVFAGEWVESTQSGELFHWYQEDFTNVVDSDPISRRIGKQEVTKGQYLIPFKNRLVAFTEAGGQFRSNDIERQDSWEDFEFQDSTQARSINVKPQAAAHVLFFASLGEDDARGGRHCALREYVYNDAIIAEEAMVASSHAYKLPPVQFKHICVCANLWVVVCIAREGSVAYIYRSGWDGNRKYHGAWTTFHFDETAPLLSGCVLDNELFLLFEKNEFVIERMTLEYGERDIEAIGDGGITSDPGGGDDLVVRLIPTIARGPSPLSVTFDASGTTGNGAIVSFEWDFDGDGIFGESGAEATAANDSTPSAQSFTTSTTVTVRATDNAGNVGTASCFVDIIGTGGGESQGGEIGGGAGQDFGTDFDGDIEYTEDLAGPGFPQ